MTCARLRQSARKRREARKAKERKSRRVPALSLLPPPPELSERPEPCTHTWGEPVYVSFSRSDHAVLRVCETCQGFRAEVQAMPQVPFGLRRTGRRVRNALVGFRVVAERAWVRPQEPRRRANTVRVAARWQ